MQEHNNKFASAIKEDAVRKIRRQKYSRSAWLGFGVIGVIGWSVVIPALLGAALGLWLDTHYPSSYSWTLMLLIGGVMLGCINAWIFVLQETKAIEKERQL